VEKYTDVNKFIKINQKINVEIKLGVNEGVYDSRIENFVDDSVFISMPSVRGVPIVLPEGAMVEISYVSDSGRYSFTSKVLSKLKDVVALIEVSKPEAIYRKELREFFRINSGAKVKIVFVKEDEDGIITDEIFDAYVQDISGGGMRIVTTTRLERGQEVEIYFNDIVPNLKSAKAAVMRSSIHEDGKCELGLKFVGMSAIDRDKVIKYVFKRQIELRKLIG
jgi:c-di-GMP-binding flagellar brake protein YcgR